jgi:hypothetical protein
VARELDALAAAVRAGAADAECFAATMARIDTRDAGSWFREWTAAAGAEWARALSTGEARAYLHAAIYYAAALARIATSDGWVDERRLRRRQHDCWQAAAARLDGTMVRIPGGAGVLSGWFFSAGPGNRPLTVIDRGTGETPSAAWSAGGAAARARGHHWLTFDAPGLGHDRESVLSAVMDAMSARDDVDPSRIVVIGIGSAGYGVPRALAFEQRFAAAVVAPGLVDASRSWFASLPRAAREAFEAGERELFEQELHLAALFDPTLEARLRRGGDGCGRHFYDLAALIARQRLGSEATQITTPLLCCRGGQSEELIGRLAPGIGTLLSAEPDDDAVWDWLARHL